MEYVTWCDRGMGIVMTPSPPRRTNILIRSLALQLFLNYKTMQGAGYLFSLKSELAGQNPEKIKAAASFINGHPVFSSIALGALTRQFRNPVDQNRADAISDWKRAMSTPLGSIGDSLIWERFKPALLAFAVSLLLLTSGQAEHVWGWAVVGMLLVYNGGLWLFRNWGFARGFELGERASELALHPALLKARRELKYMGIFCAGILFASAITLAMDGGVAARWQFIAGFMTMLGAAFVRASTLTVAFIAILSSFGIYYFLSQTTLLP